MLETTPSQQAVTIIHATNLSHTAGTLNVGSACEAWLIMTSSYSIRSDFIEFYPTEPSPYFLTQKVWRAERQVFEALKLQLESGFWTVFHQSGITHTSNPQSWHRGEIDFLFSHFTGGILVVEVKGGQIKIEEGQWKVRPLKGGEFQLMTESPSQKAQRHLRCLLERLSVESEIQKALQCETAAECQKLLRRHSGFAVCFPDLIINQDLTADLPRSLIIDKIDLTRIESRIAEILTDHCQEIRGCELPGAIKIVLRNLLAPSIAL